MSELDATTFVSRRAWGWRSFIATSRIRYARASLELIQPRDQYKIPARGNKFLVAAS